MIVCVCRSVSDKKIKHLINEHGVTDLKTIRSCTSLGNQCGKCLKYAKQIMDETLALKYKEVS